MNTSDVQAQKRRYGIVGNSEGLNHAVDIALQVAKTDLSVLITGESGVGKEIIPRIIHDNSLRKTKKYFAVNCGSIPEGTIDSELFGHEKGAFTGAVGEREGYFGAANGGTLFLDEVGELPLATQARLLRVLETGEYIKVGDTKPTRVNVRFIAATNRNLSEEIAAGRFREDLFYRLSVFQVSLPPLRERVGDVPLLARAFVKQLSRQSGHPVNAMTPAFLHALEQQPWKGNIRELRNVIERSLIVCEGDSLDVQDLPLDMQQGADGQPAAGDFELSAMERRHIARVLNYTKGNKTEAARLLKIGLTTLYRKIEEYKL